jgi:glycolate oxidase iron-sulfur subunit
VSDAPTSPTPATPRFPFEEADRCVLCGLCLPHCPTYRATQDENESPRGRIVLMRAAASGSLQVNERFAGHLSLCLGCRACERACPSGVRYERILEAGRAQLRRDRPLGFFGQLGLGIAVRPRLLRLVGRLLRVYQTSGLQRLMRTSGLLRPLGLQSIESALPPLPAAATWQARYPAQGTQRGSVALFLGCVARVADTETIASAIRLLTRLGFAVLVPENQTCCGALHRETGDAASAEKRRSQNLAAFGLPEVEVVVSLVSGCGATLAEYGREDPAAAKFSARLRDISAFLAEVDLPGTLELAPLARTVAVQDPCSLRNALRAERHVYTLLERIPELRVVPLPDNHLCCGGAGAYPLRQPAMAAQLRTPKLAQLAQLRPDTLVSANFGCALHLAAGLRAQDMDIPLLHPLVLFEKQLQDKRA